jgi:hypothetical protein
MRANHQFAKYTTGAIAIAALGGGIATAGSLLGTPVGAIVLTEVCAFACLVTFTLLIWGAILDGRQPDRTIAEQSLVAQSAEAGPRPLVGTRKHHHGDSSSQASNPGRVGGSGLAPVPAYL